MSFAFSLYTGVACLRKIVQGEFWRQVGCEVDPRACPFFLGFGKK